MLCSVLTRGTQRRILNVMCSCFHSKVMVDTEESADTMNERKEVPTKSVRVSDSEAGRLCTAAMAGSVQSIPTGLVL